MDYLVKTLEADAGLGNAEDIVLLLLAVLFFGQVTHGVLSRLENAAELAKDFSFALAGG